MVTSGNYVCYDGKITKVEYGKNGWRIDLDSTFGVEISQENMDIINYNLEKARETNANCKLIGLIANIYIFEDISKLEIYFDETMSYSLSIRWHNKG